MYGLVNRSIEELIVARFGAATWEKIRIAAGVEDEVFLSNESYPDAMTFRLVGSASEVLGLSPEAILETFGEHWVLKTARESYGAMLDVCGRSLPEFLRNLPNLHSRVILLFPRLQPPNFTVSNETPSSLVLHHGTHRDGLAHFTIGLIRGLGKHFNTPVTVTLVERRTATSKRDSFLIEWNQAQTTPA